MGVRLSSPSKGVPGSLPIPTLYGCEPKPEAAKPGDLPGSLSYGFDTALQMRVAWREELRGEVHGGEKDPRSRARVVEWS